MMQDGHLPPLKEHPPYADEHDYNCANVMRQTEDSFVGLVRKAAAEAVREGIKVNSIVINENMVKVPETVMALRGGHSMHIPTMFCGLNVYFTKDELPEMYSFALVNGPDNRLAQFESIGMEPDELRKAAELYRRIKEVME